MKIAIVHDDFVQSGGAEKLVLVMLEIWTDADLFTSFISENWKNKLRKQFPNLKIVTTFINRLPLVEKFYKYYAFLYPMAFESMDLRKYDVVVSSSARFAHGVITLPKTLHVSYVNSPGRMIWEPASYFSKPIGFFQNVILSYLRIWDYIASKRPNFIIANSKTSQLRISKYWKRESEIIYPFYDFNKNINLTFKTNTKDYFLIVSRLEDWKKIDIAIQACTNLKEKLHIVGNGSSEKYLKSLSNSKYVKFMGQLSEADLIKQYKDCKALIITQREDFGITSLEAQSFGKPVIAYKAGGALDILQAGDNV